jgi:hypothetical protein
MPQRARARIQISNIRVTQVKPLARVTKRTAQCELRQCKVALQRNCDGDRSSVPNRACGRTTHSERRTIYTLFKYVLFRTSGNPAHVLPMLNLVSFAFCLITSESCVAPAGPQGTARIPHADARAIMYHIWVNQPHKCTHAKFNV